MGHPSYSFSCNKASRYTFTSEGKRRIEKIVEFTPTNINDIFNLAFGDVSPDGAINDLANSNNGDMLKVLSTIIHILEDFTTRYPHAGVFFSGSTDERTLLYMRVIKTYSTAFRTAFDIRAIIKSECGYRQIAFVEPLPDAEYIAFLIKRIS